MSFLTPFYVLGLSAVIAPLVFHLIRRSPRGEVPFSSLMFLSRDPAATHSAQPAGPSSSALACERRRCACWLLRLRVRLCDRPRAWDSEMSSGDASRS